MAYWADDEKKRYEIPLEITHSITVDIIASSYEEAISFLKKEFEDDSDHTHFDFESVEPDCVYTTKWGITTKQDERIQIY